MAVCSGSMAAAADAVGDDDGVAPSGAGSDWRVVHPPACLQGWAPPVALPLTMMTLMEAATAALRDDEVDGVEGEEG